MYGIKETKEVFDFSLAFAAYVDKSLQNGFQLTDLFGAVEPLSKAPAAFENISEVEKEVLDLDDDERKELATYVSETYNIKDDVAEALVEQGIRGAIENYKFMLMLRNAKK